MKINEDVIIETLDTVTFFTEIGNPTAVYVSYKDLQGIRQFTKSTNEEFQAFLRHLYRVKADEFCAPPLEPYIKAYEDDAIVRKYETGITVHRRVFGNLTTRIVYSLSNDQSEVVVISKEGWKVGRSSKFHFLKCPFDKPQVAPVAGGNLLTLLRPYVNLTQDDFLLFVVHLVQCFSRSDHFVAILTGQQGTGKSSLSKMIRLLIDPSDIDVNDLPKTRGDLVNLLTNNFLVCFDNAERFNESVSDLLCSAVTGTTSSRRRLYSDSEQVVLHLHNTIVINGISVIPRKADFAERSLLFDLIPIPKDKRIGSREHWRKFDLDRPLILGAIFDTLSKAMNILPTLDVAELHRMADAHLEMLAIAMALGIRQDKFEKILQQNNAKLTAVYAEQNRLVEALVTFMGTQNKISGPVTKIYTEFFESLVGDKRFFPKSASALTRKLNEERSAIEAAGYRIVQGKTASSNTLTISKIPQNQLKK